MKTILLILLSTACLAQDLYVKVSDIQTIRIPKGSVYYDTLPKGVGIFYRQLWTDHGLVDTTKQIVVKYETFQIDAVSIPSVLGSIDNVDPRNKYTGDWTAFNKSVFHNGTSTYTLIDGVVEITFIGKKIEWWTEKAENHGIVGLSIDGGEETTVDLYANTTVNNTQKVWTSPDLTAGEHKLKIRFTGNRNELATQANFIHDRIIVIK